ncbi:MAG: long-chain fatty acid--CoA ligase [Acidobacteria bacterium]|nr:long-chain fatty acid--CoA ligase [Acidobacteriota bacterium]
MTALIQRIEAFIAAGDGAFDGEFVELAAAAVRYGYERVEPYRRLCDRRGIDPGALEDWRLAPAVPTSAFKSLRLAAAEPREVFRSSGTTRGAERRSVHYHPYPDLYRTVVDASFADACLPAGTGRLPILSLIPDRAIAPDSSLSFMAAHVFERHAAPGSAWAVQDAGIDLDLACRWLRARAEGEPVLVLATALALVLLLDRLEDEAGGAIRLAPGSRVFETGGFKGRSLETTPEAVRRRARTLLSLRPDAVVREYGMTELTSQAYSRPGGERLRTPPWMPFRVLDPETLEEVEDGETGLLALFDLANVGSVCHVLTEDLGVREDGAFRLLGRASGAELRGCSLTAEELGAM